MINILFLLVLFVFVNNSQAIITTADLSVSVVNQTLGQMGGTLELTITNNSSGTYVSSNLSTFGDSSVLPKARYRIANDGARSCASIVISISGLEYQPTRKKL